MNLNHKFGVKTCIAGCVVHFLETRAVDSVHCYLVKSLAVNAGLACNAACSSVSACDCAVVKEKNLCVLVKTELLASVNGHIGNDCTG